MTLLRHLCVTAVATLLLNPGIAHADTTSSFDEVLAMSPGVTQSELEADIAIIAADTGRTTEVVLEEMVLGARMANGSADTPVAAPNDRDKKARSSVLSSGGGGDGLLYKVVAGCSTVGNYTYSYARNYGQNHGHNAIYYTGCTLVESPGSGKRVTRVASTHQYASHPSYVAHIRSPKNVSSAQRANAGKFANSKVGLPYNLKFYANRVVNGSSYNCSQLVWAAWRSAANIDLSGHSRSGIYPDDLRRSPISSFVKNMARA